MVFQKILHTLGLRLRKQVECLLEYLPKSTSEALGQEREILNQLESLLLEKRIRVLPFAEK